MTLPYSEGTVFLVPLTTGGYGRGVVARSPPEGKVLFGYFFGPRLSSPSEFTFYGLEPNSAVLRIKFGDLGLINGAWPLCGRLPDWNRAPWTMPDLVRRDPLSKRAWAARYSDDNPRVRGAEYPVPYDSDMPSDTLSGYGAAEMKLTKCLDTESA